MHEPSKSESQQAKGDKITKGHKGTKPRRPSGGMDAFASADDYQQQIEADLAAMPAEVEGSISAQPAKLHRSKAGVKHKQKRRQ